MAQELCDCGHSWWLHDDTGCHEENYLNEDGVFYFDEPKSRLRFSINKFTDGTTPDGHSIQAVEDLSWLDPQTSICHEAIIGKWLQAYRSNTLNKSLTVSIRVDEILAMRGIKKNKGSYRPAQKLDYAKRIMQIESVLVHGSYVDPEGKKHHLKGRVVDIVVDDEEDLLGNKTPYEFRVRPAAAVWEFYASSEYLADYYLALARLDVRQGVERMAYMIGRYLMHQYRIRETHNQKQPFKVRTICEQSDIEIEAKANHQPRFREHFDAALDKLQEIGVIRRWQYVDGDEERLPTRGWFRPWLDESRIVIEPPETVLERAAIRSAEHRRRLETAKHSRSRTRKKDG
jgi:hypothetical protein